MKRVKRLGALTVLAAAVAEADLSPSGAEELNEDIAEQRGSKRRRRRGGKAAVGRRRLWRNGTERGRRGRR